MVHVSEGEEMILMIQELRLVAPLSTNTDYSTRTLLLAKSALHRLAACYMLRGRSLVPLSFSA